MAAALWHLRGVGRGRGILGLSHTLIHHCLPYSPCWWFCHSVAFPFGPDASTSWHFQGTAPPEELPAPHLDSPEVSVLTGRSLLLSSILPAAFSSPRPGLLSCVLLCSIGDLSQEAATARLERALSAEQTRAFGISAVEILRLSLLLPQMGTSVSLQKNFTCSCNPKPAIHYILTLCGAAVSSRGLGDCERTETDGCATNLKTARHSL